MLTLLLHRYVKSSQDNHYKRYQKINNSNNKKMKMSKIYGLIVVTVSSKVKVRFLLGGGGGPGDFGIFLRKKSWPSHFLECFNA